jgi:hypothetical protein
VNPHRLIIAPQFGASQVEPKTAEPDLFVHRMHGPEFFRSLNRDLKVALPAPSSTLAATEWLSEWALGGRN